MAKCDFLGPGKNPSGRVQLVVNGSLRAVAALMLALLAGCALVRQSDPAAAIHGEVIPLDLGGIQVEYLGQLQSITVDTRRLTSPPQRFPPPQGDFVSDAAYAQILRRGDPYQIKLGEMVTHQFEKMFARASNGGSRPTSPVPLTVEVALRSHDMCHVKEDKQNIGFGDGWFAAYVDVEIGLKAGGRLIESSRGAGWHVANSHNHPLDKTEAVEAEIVQSAFNLASARAVLYALNGLAESPVVTKLKSHRRSLEEESVDLSEAIDNVISEALPKEASGAVVAVIPQSRLASRDGINSLDVRFTDLVRLRIEKICGCTVADASLTRDALRESGLNDLADKSSLKDFALFTSADIVIVVSALDEGATANMWLNTILSKSEKEKVASVRVWKDDAVEIFRGFEYVRTFAGKSYPGTDQDSEIAGLWSHHGARNPVEALRDCRNLKPGSQRDDCFKVAHVSIWCTEIGKTCGKALLINRRLDFQTRIFDLVYRGASQGAYTFDSYRGGSSQSFSLRVDRRSKQSWGGWHAQESPQARRRAPAGKLLLDTDDFDVTLEPAR